VLRDVARHIAQIGDHRAARVHGGGEYHPSRDPRHASCDARYQELERAIVAALAKRTAGA
jgi:ribosomal protein L4